MAFVRIKKIQGKEYAYKVWNVWRKRKQSSRQKQTKYLGKLYKPKIIGNQTFQEYVKDVEEYFETHFFKEIIYDMIKAELKNLDVPEAVTIDFQRHKVHIKERNVVLKMNEGFFCTLTFRELINFKGSGIDRQVGEQLAKKLLEVGLKVEPEIFVQLFQKI